MYVEEDTSWLRDWMVKGGLDLVVVGRQLLFERLQRDEIVGDKVRVVSAKEQLGDQLIDVYQSKLRERCA